MKFIELLFAMLVLVGGFILFASYLWKSYFEELKKRKNYKKTTGFCVDVDKYYKYKNGEIGYEIKDATDLVNLEGSYYLPIVIYKVGDKEYQVTSTIGKNKRFVLKRKRTVFYKSENPSEAVLSDAAIFWLLSSIFISLATLFMIYSFGNILYQEYYNRKYPDQEYL